MAHVVGVCEYGHTHALLHSMRLLSSNFKLVTVLRGSISDCLMKDTRVLPL